MLCFQGDGKKDVTCDLSNVGYEAKCSRCPTEFAYIGETSQAAYTRFREHFDDYRAATTDNLPALPPDDMGGQHGQRKARAKSWMWEHGGIEWGQP